MTKSTNQTDSKDDTILYLRRQVEFLKKKCRESGTKKREMEDEINRLWEENQNLKIVKFGSDREAHHLCLVKNPIDRTLDPCIYTSRRQPGHSQEACEAPVQSVALVQQRFYRHEGTSLLDHWPALLLSVYLSWSKD